MDTDTLIRVGVPILTAILAYVASEITRRVSHAHADGVKDEAATVLAAEFWEFKEKTERHIETNKTASMGIAVLANEFHEFKTDMKQAIERLFDRLEKLSSERGEYPCHQLGCISAMKSQVDANTARLDRVQRSQSEIEQFLLQRLSRPIAADSQG